MNVDTGQLCGQEIFIEHDIVIGSLPKVGPAVRFDFDAVTAVDIPECSGVSHIMTNAVNCVSAPLKNINDATGIQ